MHLAKSTIQRTQVYSSGKEKLSLPIPECLAIAEKPSVAATREKPVPNEDPAQPQIKYGEKKKKGGEVERSESWT